MQTSCLFLKPQVTTAEDLVKQNQDIKTFIKPAIAQAGLSVIDDQTDGLEVVTISDDLIQKIFQADILIIDANWYETSGLFQLSPYLFYAMGVGHSRGNATILVANSAGHLPYNLNKYHALTYSLAEIWLFLGKFQVAVNEIRQHQNSRPDNPVQDYLKQEELIQARRQIAEMQAKKTPEKQGKPPRIIFLPVEKDWE